MQVIHEPRPRPVRDVQRGLAVHPFALRVQRHVGIGGGWEEGLLPRVSHAGRGLERLAKQEVGVKATDLLPEPRSSIRIVGAVRCCCALH